MYPCILSHIYGTFRAVGKAISALYAAIGHLYHLLVERYQFGVMAPFTVERTALEKNCRSYSRAVLCAELFVWRPLTLLMVCCSLIAPYAPAAPLILPALLILIVRRSVDYNILSALVQFCKVCHISGNTDHQALMLFRIYLGIFKRVGIHNIDLDVLSAMVEVSLDDSSILWRPFSPSTPLGSKRRLNRLRHESVLTHGCYGFDCGCRAVDIPSHHRGSVVAQWLAGLSAIRSGSAYHTVGYIYSLRMYIEGEASASGVRPLLYIISNEVHHFFYICCQHARSRFRIFPVC